MSLFGAHSAIDEHSFPDADIPRLRCRWIAFLAALSLMSFRIVTAQNYLTSAGAPTFAAPEPVELGFTNTANGVLHLEIPIASFPQRGSKEPLSLRFEYDSDIWNTYSTGPTTAAWAPGNGLTSWNWGGWAVPLPGVGFASGATFDNNTCETSWEYDEGFGTKHFFPLKTGPASWGCPASASGYATDSSGYWLNVSNNGLNASVYAPDGTLVTQTINNGSVNDSSGRTILAEDSNGNYLSGLAPPPYQNLRGLPLVSDSRIYDTLGRMVLHYAPPDCNTSGQTCLDVPNSQGSVSRYVVTKTTIYMTTSFGQPNVAECTTTQTFSCSMVVVQSISLPDGSKYAFQYDCDPSASGNSSQICSSPTGQGGYYGLLTVMTLPTGGQITYGYTTFKDSYSNKTRWLSSKTSSGGQWTYSPTVVSNCSPTSVGCQQQVTVTKPSGDSTVTTFTLNNGAWPVQVQNYGVVQNYGLGKPLLSTVNNTWDFSHGCPLPNCYGASYIRMTDTTTTEYISNGAAITKKTHYDYDGYQDGLVTSIKEWKFYSGASPSFPATADRTTTFSYYTVADNNNINRPTITSVYDSANHLFSQTSTVYDSATLTPISNIANHDDTNFGTGFTTRGNPTVINRCTNPAVCGSNYLKTTMSYDQTGQMVKEVDPAGTPTSYGYNDSYFNDAGSGGIATYPLNPYTPAPATNAYLTSVTDAIGTQSYGYYFGSGKDAFSKDYNGEITYSHFLDSMDRQTETDYPIGWDLAAYTSETLTASYSAVGDLSPSFGCLSCRQVQYTFDGLARKTTETLVNNPSVTSSPAGPSEVDTAYDSNGRIQTVSHPHIGSTDPNNVLETYGYDGLDRTVQVLHPDGQASQMFLGQAVSAASQQSSPTVYGYGYPIESVDEAGKRQLKWIDGFGRVIEVDEGITVGSPTQATGSCGFSGVASSTQTLTVGTWSKTLFLSTTYSGSQAASAVASNLSSSGLVTATASGSNVSVTSIASGSSTNYPLSATGFYGGCSGLSGGTDGAITSQFFTAYQYDTGDRLTQVSQGVQTRSFVYDGIGRLTSRTTPEAGTETLYYTTSAGALCAGDLSAVCRKTDARGITTTYAYDTANRLKSKSYSDGTPSVSYAYDQGGASAHALGRLTSMTDGSGSETYTYGAMGRVSQLTKVVGTTSYAIGYQYNAAGQITQITYPSGHVLQQSYDAVGRLCEVAPLTSGCGSASSPYSTGYIYNGADQLLSLKYGNGVAGTFSYDPKSSMLSTLSYGKGTQTYFGLNYYYQQDSTYCKNAPVANNGQIQCIWDNVDSGRSATYTYDSLGRIITAVTNGSSGFAKWGLSWGFDRYGNRLNQTLTAGTGPQNLLSFANPGGAQTNQPDGMCFDAAGNLLHETAKPCPNPTYKYDAENRMTSYNGTVGAYTYDGNGLRVKKAANGTTTVILYANGHDIAEYDNGAAPGSPTREFTYSGDDLLTTVAGGKTTYHHEDQLSVRLTTDGTTGSSTYGQVLSQAGTYPYGESWYTTGTGFPDGFLFTTYERDTESGLDYAMARFYESRYGRFCSADPVMGQAEDPQTWNRYAYVRNDPINLTDPSGQDWMLTLWQVLFSIFSFASANPALSAVEQGSAGASPLLISAMNAAAQASSREGQQQGQVTLPPLMAQNAGQPTRTNCPSWTITATIVGKHQATRDPGALSGHKPRVGDVAINPEDFGYDDYYDLAKHSSTNQKDKVGYANYKKLLGEQRELKNAHITLTPTSQLPQDMPSKGPYPATDVYDKNHHMPNTVDVYRGKNDRGLKGGNPQITVIPSLIPNGRVKCPK